MTENQIDAVAAVMRHTEAPYSFNLKAYDPDGFDCMFTIRDEDGPRFMSRVTKLRAWLVESGYTSSRRAPANANGATNGSAATAVVPSCQFHGDMKRSQHGGWYCPSKMGDGTYCKEVVK